MKVHSILVFVATVLTFLSACGTSREKDQKQRYPTPAYRERPAGGAQGLASWYGKKFHGRKTASGERFDMHEFTAAHRTLPFGTQVEVTNLATEKTVTVRINDRGPFSGNRIIDLSYAAAKELGIVASGVAKVAIRPVGH